MNNRNSISLFTKEFYIKRNIPSDPYAGLTWEDTEMLFSSILLDMVNSLSELNNCDIMLFMNNSDLKKDIFDKIKEKAFVIDTDEQYENDKLKFALQYIARNGYERNIFLFNYFPVYDLSYIKNIFLWLADEQDYVFVASLKDMSLGMLAMRNIQQSIINDLTYDKILDVEKVISSLVSQDLYLIQTGTLPSLIDLNDLALLKNKLDEMIKEKIVFPKFTYETLKQLTKKYISNHKSYETRDIRRYF